MKRKELEDRVTHLMNQLLEESDLELIDVAFVKEGRDFFLRIFIDKPGGVTINDCEKMSRLLEAKLDEYDWIQDQYYLEMSSPGLDRPLKKQKDFERNLGKRVEVKLYQLLEGEKLFTGILVDYSDEQITIETDDKKRIIFNESQVALVRLAITF